MDLRWKYFLTLISATIHPLNEPTACFYRLFPQKTQLDKYN
jgi:hypothetical protein